MNAEIQNPNIEIQIADRTGGRVGTRKSKIPISKSKLRTEQEAA